MTAREHAEAASGYLADAREGARELSDNAPAHVKVAMGRRLESANATASAHALTALALVVAGPNSAGTLVDALGWLTEAVRR